MDRIHINRPVRKPLVPFANGTKYCEPVSLVRELEGSLMGRNIYTILHETHHPDPDASHIHILIQAFILIQAIKRRLKLTIQVHMQQIYLK